MANRGTIVRKKRKERAAPVVRRGSKLIGPSFIGHDTWTGEEYHIKQRAARDFYYENYKPADLLADVWAWMKEQKYSAADIRAARAQGVGVAASINCKLLRSGMPDLNEKHAEYWTSLEGTGDVLHPVSQFIKRKLEEAIAKGKAIVDIEVQAAQASKPVRQNIQELMRERAGDASAELDVIFDEFVSAGCPKEFETQKRILAELETRKILPQHISTIIKAWERIRAERVEAMEGKDVQLVEGYKSYSRTQMKNILRFVEQVITDLNAYVAIKQATKTKTVRLRKPIPIEKIVARMKYLKAFKDATVDLTSFIMRLRLGCTMLRSASYITTSLMIIRSA